MDNYNTAFLFIAIVFSFPMISLARKAWNTGDESLGMFLFDLALWSVGSWFWADAIVRLIQ